MPSFIPEYNGPIGGFVTNYIGKNYWKVKRTIPQEDLFQEAQVVFLQCKRKYWYVETPQHFQSLFMRCWHNRFIDLSNADTRDRCMVSDTNADGETTTSQASCAGDQELAVMLRQAPSEVLAVVNLFLNTPQELLAIALAGWLTDDNSSTAKRSVRINRLLGLPKSFDSLKMVRDYFMPQSC